jgi:hypothetical protein
VVEDGFAAVLRHPAQRCVEPLGLVGPIVDEMRLALRGCRQGDGALLREPSRLGSRVLVGPDNRQKAIGVKAIHCVVSVLPAGTPNAINGVPCPFSSVLHSCVPSYCYLQGQLPYRSVSLAFFASWREKRSWRSGGAQRRAPKRDGSRLGSPTLRTTTFVQQLKRQNAPRARNSLFLWAQELARRSSLVRAQNSGTTRATRPTGRGTLRSGADPAIDDL